MEWNGVRVESGLEYVVGSYESNDNKFLSKLCVKILDELGRLKKTL